MKTISELNDKMWYRALKVIYLFFVGVCYLVATASIAGYTYWIYDEHQNYQTKNEHYQTGFKEEEYNKLESENEKAIVKYGFVKDMNKEQIEIALNKYRSDPNILLATSTHPESIIINGVPRQVSLIDKMQALNNPPFPEMPVNPHTLLYSLGMLLFIPWSYFWAWLATMLPRWIVYYVVLGSIRPEK